MLSLGSEALLEKHKKQNWEVVRPGGEDKGAWPSEGGKELNGE